MGDPLTNKLAGLESAAASVLVRAVELDHAKKQLQAVTLYSEGVSMLMDVLKSGGCDEEKREKLREKIGNYISRAERLKTLIDREKATGNFHEQILIRQNDIGHSYDTVFKALLDPDVTQVWLNDPYIRMSHQILNLVRFCEVVVKRAPKLAQIHLTTGRDDQDSSRKYQDTAFKELTDSLAQRSIALRVSYSPTLHDRDIKFDNGWIVKIGRGLDYFRPLPKFSIGAHDFDLRPCHQTNIDIFHEKSLCRTL